MTRQYLHVQSLSLVALGGALGAATREALLLAMPDAGPLPVAIIVANIAGAFLLGVLYAKLNRRDALDNRPSGTGLPRSRRLRLLLGTGFCGGFTTYSTLAVGMLLLTGMGTSNAGSAATASAGLAWAAAYGLGTVLAGALATWAGIALGTGSRAAVERRTDLPETTQRGGQQP